MREAESREQHDIYLIGGLGKPRRHYAHNPQNAGAMCLRRLAAAHSLSFSRSRKRARVADGTIASHRVVLALPQTFMNESGRPIARLVQFYQVTPDHLLVVYDDLDLPLGNLRLRPGGGSGGHKGMKSIIQHLGNDGFARLRIGIGRPPGRMDPADYVLQNFTAEENPIVEDALERAVAAIETWLEAGIEAAMTRYNS